MLGSGTAGIRGSPEVGMAGLSAASGVSGVGGLW